MSTKINPFPEGLTFEEMQDYLIGSTEYEIAYDLDNMNRRHDYEVLRDYFAGLKRGVPRDELWAGRFDGFSRSKLRAVFAELSEWNRSYSRARKTADIMADYLKWYDADKKRTKSQDEINAEVLESISGYSPEERALFLVCEIADLFGSAKTCEKSCSKTWKFERVFNELKSHKTRFGWDNQFIFTKLGVNYNACKKLYYRLNEKP